MAPSRMGLLRRFFPSLARPSYDRQSYYLCYYLPNVPTRSIKRSHMLTWTNSQNPFVETFRTF